MYLLLLLLQNLRRGLNYICKVLNITDKHWLEQKKLGFKNKKYILSFSYQVGCHIFLKLHFKL